MGTASYRFRNCEIPTTDGRTMVIDGCAIIRGHESWKVVSISVDGVPALCAACRDRIREWLHRPDNAGAIAKALQRDERIAAHRRLYWGNPGPGGCQKEFLRVKDGDTDIR